MIKSTDGSGEVGVGNEVINDGGTIAGKRCQSR